MATSQQEIDEARRSKAIELAIAQLRHDDRSIDTLFHVADLVDTWIATGQKP